MSRYPIIIIGTGLAGFHLAKEFRKYNQEQPLILVTQDEGHFYSKPQLSTALFHAKSPQQLIITDCNNMAEQLNATIFTFTAVEEINTHRQEISLRNESGKQTLVYDRLVLAMGAKPNSFPLADNIKHHYRVNSLFDYGLLMNKLTASNAVTIVGSGLVGCELAHDFTHLNKKIHLISPEPYPLFRFVPPIVGEALQHAMAQQGIHWHTQMSINHIREEQQAIQLQFSNGTTLSTDLLISAIGLTPNLTLAKQADLEINQGIVVNTYLQTSHPNIYALGDCAQIQGECRYFVAPILHCARALAQTLCQKATPVTLPTLPIVLKVKSYPMVIMPPKPAPGGSWQYVQTPDGIKALYQDEDENVLGYVLTGKFQAQRQEIETQLAISPF